MEVQHRFVFPNDTNRESTSLSVELAVTSEGYHDAVDCGRKEILERKKHASSRIGFTLEPMDLAREEPIFFPKTNGRGRKSLHTREKYIL